MNFETPQTNETPQSYLNRLRDVLAQVEILARQERQIGGSSAAAEYEARAEELRLQIKELTSQIEINENDHKGSTLAQMLKRQPGEIIEEMRQMEEERGGDPEDVR